MSEGNQHINYTAADIEKYRKGQLSTADMHAMEEAALDDPFLADAMEGYGAGGETIHPLKEQLQTDLTELQQRLTERVNNHNKPAAVISFFWWKAAAVAFLFAGAAWFYAANNKIKDQSIARNDASKNEPTPADKTDTALNLPGVIARTDTQGDMAKNYKSGEEKKIAAFKKTNSRAVSASAARPAPSQTDDSRRETIIDKDALAAVAQKPVTAAPQSIPQNLSGNDEERTKNAVAGRAATVGNTFKGTLVDASEQPMANTIIQIPKLNIATVTNNKGYFSFQAPDTALKVSIAAAGYETQQLELTTNSIVNTDNIIRLKPSLLSLNDVAIGYGTAKKKEAPSHKQDITIKILDAEPVISWNDYNQYLAKNKRISADLTDVHGEVQVSFTVNKKNQLINFRIDTSLEEELDTEAIRLIKEGPAWRLLKGDSARASVTVKF